MGANEAMIAEAATAAAVAAGAATMAVAALASDPELAKEIEQELANNPDLAAGLPNMENLESLLNQYADHPEDLDQAEPRALSADDDGEEDVEDLDAEEQPEEMPYMSI